METLLGAAAESCETISTEPNVAVFFDQVSIPFLMWFAIHNLKPAL
jgi:hypothetical protein